jgi:hypothetical protein
MRWTDGRSAIACTSMVYRAEKSALQFEEQYLLLVTVTYIHRFKDLELTHMSLLRPSRTHFCYHGYYENIGRLHTHCSNISNAFLISQK